MFSCGAGGRAASSSSCSSSLQRGNTQEGQSGVHANRVATHTNEGQFIRYLHDRSQGLRGYLTLYEIRSYAWGPHCCYLSSIDGYGKRIHHVCIVSYVYAARERAIASPRLSIPAHDAVSR